MITVSDAYKAQMLTDSSFQEVATITLADGTVLELDNTRFSATGNSVVDGAESGDFPLGIAIERQIQLDFRNDDEAYKDYDFLAATVKLYADYDVDGETVRISKGVYTVTAVTYGDYIILTAVDDMSKADDTYSSALTFPATLADMLTEICDNTGIPLGSSTFNHSDFEAYSQPSGTYREVIGYIAMIAGGNARIDNDGYLQILSYDLTGFDTGDYHELTLVKSISVEGADVIITGLKTSYTDEDTGETGYKTFGTDSYMLTIENPLIYGQETDVLAWIYSCIGGAGFRPFNATIVANPLIEFMDLATIVDWRGNVYNTIITDVEFVFYGSTTIKNTAPAISKTASKYAADVHIVSYTKYYAISSSNTAAPSYGSSWYTSQPATTTSQPYLWQCYCQVFSDGSVSWTEAELINATYEIWNLAEGTSDDWEEYTVTDQTNCCRGDYFSYNMNDRGLAAGDLIQVSMYVKFSEDFAATGTDTAYMRFQCNCNYGGTWVTVSITGGNMADQLLSVLNSDSREGYISTYIAVTSAMVDGTYSGTWQYDFRFDYYAGTFYIKQAMFNIGTVPASWALANSEIATNESVSSQIEQLKDSITLSVSNGTSSSVLSILAGSVELSSATIQFTGVVTYTDLSTSGSTTINGSNITTGTISTERIKLGGKMTVYQSSSSTTAGGYIGYMTGATSSSTTSGIALMSTDSGNYVIATTSGVRLQAGSSELFITENSLIEAYGTGFLIGSYLRVSGAHIYVGNSYGLYGYNSSSSGAYRLIAIGSDNYTYVGNGTYTSVVYGNPLYLNSTSYATYIRGSSITVQGVMTSNGNITVDKSNTTSNAAFSVASADGKMVVYANYGAGVGLWDPTLSVDILYHSASSSDGKLIVGNTTYDTYIRGSTVYSNKSITVSSDERLKTDFGTMDAYDTVFDTLNPLTFRYRAGGGINMGFTYQGIVAALESAGLNADDHAVVATYTDEEAGQTYGAVAYEQIIALLVDQVQKLKSRVQTLENEVSA